MKKMGLLAILLLSFLTSQGALASVEYFIGEIRYLSPDRSTSFGTIFTLVKREVLPQEKKIIETVFQPDPNTNKGLERYVATFLQIDTSNVFAITDKQNSYTGEMSFEGPEWNWTSWTFAIQLTTGERVVGKGQRLENGMYNEKQFFRGDTLVMNITESLTRLSERQFQTKYNEFTRNNPN